MLAFQPPPYATSIADTSVIRVRWMSLEKKDLALFCSAAASQSYVPFPHVVIRQSSALGEVGACDAPGGLFGVTPVAWATNGPCCGELGGMY